MAFLRWRAGPAGYLIGIAKLAPAICIFFIDRNVETLKAAAVRVFLGGAAMMDLEREAETFALQASPELLRPDALEVWRRHQADGALMVIVTASPEAVIGPFARTLGADFLIGTKLSVDNENRLMGGFDGPNCRGPEKVARLRRVFGGDVRLLAAYGDTDGDLEMLAIAEYPNMKVFTGRPAAVTEKDG